MIQSVLIEACYRTGSFYSPYVYDFRERIQMNGEMISENDVARLTERMAEPSEELAKTPFGGPTEFEFKTAMGFIYWAETKCDYVALEVGLGGRLDSTNVIENPIVAIITEIGLDHQKNLGETIDAIAAEKAGIFKTGSPAVSGATDPLAKEAISRAAKGPLWQTPEDFRWEGEDLVTPKARRRGLVTGMLGDFQSRNLAVAVAACDLSGVAITGEALRKGLGKARVPGRLEVVDENPLTIFDGAHNGQAAKALAESLRKLYPGKRWRLVYSAVGGHCCADVLTEFEPHVAAAYICEMETARALPLHELMQTALDLLGPERTHRATGVAEAVRMACEDCRADEIVLVSGSFYLLAEAKAALRA
jgi:dihydrofolate synthase/folylpolyglutamate synthase